MGGYGGYGMQPGGQGAGAGGGQGAGPGFGGGQDGCGWLQGQPPVVV